MGSASVRELCCEKTFDEDICISPSVWGDPRLVAEYLLLGTEGEWNDVGKRRIEKQIGSLTESATVQNRCSMNLIRPGRVVGTLSEQHDEHSPPSSACDSIWGYIEAKHANVFWRSQGEKEEFDDQSWCRECCKCRNIAFLMLAKAKDFKIGY